MRDLWKGEVTRKKPLPREQGDCSLDNDLPTIVNTSHSEEYVSRLLRSESFELLQDGTIRNKSILQPLTNLDAPISPILQCYQLEQKMASIVGNYQNERNENLDEYFKAVGVPYIPRKMIAMSSPRLEISNDGDKWTIRTISMIRTVELTFTLGEEYEEHMPAGVTLKNVTTMEGDSLVTVSVGSDNNKVVRKYEVTTDGVLLTMTHENSGQVAKRYFKRLS